MKTRKRLVDQKTETLRQMRHRAWQGGGQKRLDQQHSRGFLYDVIDPAETRLKVVQALEMLQNKRDSLPAKKHGNIPL